MAADSAIKKNNVHMCVGHVHSETIRKVHGFGSWMKTKVASLAIMRQLVEL